MLVLLARWIFRIDGSLQQRWSIDIWSLATAYVALALLGATLLIGPSNVLLGRRNPVSSSLRRDLGIWAGVVSLVHVAIGLQIHSDTILGNFFCTSAGPNCLTTAVASIRVSLWGLANHLGLVATLIVLLLLALSNDRALRRLKARRWKRLQRWNYGLFVLAMIHAIAYQIVENRAMPYPFVLAMTAAIVVVAQALAFWRRRRAAALDGRTPGNP